MLYFIYTHIYSTYIYMYSCRCGLLYWGYKNAQDTVFFSEILQSRGGRPMVTNKSLTAVNGVRVGAPGRELSIIQGRWEDVQGNFTEVWCPPWTTVLPAHCLWNPSFETILCKHLKIICTDGQASSVKLKIDLNFPNGQSAWRTIYRGCQKMSTHFKKKKNY